MRGEAVVARPAERGPSAPFGAPTPTPAPPAPAFQCAAPARNARRVDLPRLRAAGAGSSAPSRDDFAQGWVWINLWATWCAPCMEELPRLRAWSQRLPLRLIFISMDDDERQLRRYLSSPRANFATTSWADDDATRARLAKALGLRESPTLPSQAVLRDGRLACSFEGAIEDRDFDRVARLVEAR